MVHVFHKGINPKLKALARLGFELGYDDIFV